MRGLEAEQQLLARVLIECFGFDHLTAEEAAVQDAICGLLPEKVWREAMWERWKEEDPDWVKEQKEAYRQKNL